MSESELTARLVGALEAAAQREAGEAALVSVTIDVAAPGAAGQIETRLVRKTRTLLFLMAELKAENGATLATANSVHKTPS